MKDISPQLATKLSESARKTGRAGKRLNECQPELIGAEAILKKLRAQLAQAPETFKNGDIVAYVGPDRMLGPFRVGIMDDGSVGLWYRRPDRPYANDDWGDHAHAILEKGETFPGTDVVTERSCFSTVGFEKDFDTIPAHRSHAGG